jgi:hypothetical protein
MKLLLLGSQHGNELLGERLYRRIKKYHPDVLEYLSFRIGNPKARRQGVRYIESDMNRSFEKKRDTYEANRARKLLAYIDEQAFDLVLDLHTTACIQPPSFIVGSMSASVKTFIRASSIRRVVHMRHEIVHSSLIGTVPQAVSIEVSNSDVSTTLLDSLIKDIQRYITSRVFETEKSLYVVDQLLLKTEVTEIESTMLTNFQPSALGFIPILVGENSYKKNTPYLGFKAAQETIITL